MSENLPTITVRDWESSPRYVGPNLQPVIDRGQRFDLDRDGFTDLSAGIYALVRVADGQTASKEGEIRFCLAHRREFEKAVGGEYVEGECENFISSKVLGTGVACVPAMVLLVRGAAQ